MELNIVQLNGKDYISAIELQIELKSIEKFASWIKRLIQRAFLKENIDFVCSIKQSTGGRPAKDYLLTNDSAKRIAIVANTKKSQEIIDYLIDLSSQRENLELLNEKEIITLSALIGFFKYVENQKEIAKINLNDYISKHPSKYSYAEFNILRNKILGISKEEIEKRLVEYCTEYERRIPSLKTMRDKILFLDMYDSLKNAVWDFLYINGAPTALKMSELAKKMAKAQGLQILPKNETNLFQIKEYLPKLVELKKN